MGPSTCWALWRRSPRRAAASASTRQRRRGSRASPLTRVNEGPTLVVAPTSVCANWLSEAARFAPSLRVAEYAGSERSALLAQVAFEQRAERQPSEAPDLPGAGPDTEPSTITTEEPS